MLNLNEKYLVDKENKPVAVQLDIETFKRLEEVGEDDALAQYMNEAQNDEMLNLGGKSVLPSIKKVACKSPTVKYF